jgi:hypothetical protein
MVEAYLSGLSPDAQYFVYTLNESAATDYGVSSQLIFSPMEQDVLERFWILSQCEQL